MLHLLKKKYNSLTSCNGVHDQATRPLVNSKPWSWLNWSIRELMANWISSSSQASNYDRLVFIDHMPIKMSKKYKCYWIRKHLALTFCQLERKWCIPDLFLSECVFNSFFFSSVNSPCNAEALLQIYSGGGGQKEAVFVSPLPSSFGIVFMMLAFQLISLFHWQLNISHFSPEVNDAGWF